MHRRTPPGCRAQTPQSPPTQATGAWGTITHFGIFDASSSGNLLYHGALTASKTIATGDVLKIT
ncbi:MAG: phage tail fiber protein, partial [Flavobacteriales bacterium]